MVREFIISGSKEKINRLHYIVMRSVCSPSPLHSSLDLKCRIELSADSQFVVHYHHWSMQGFSFILFVQSLYLYIPLLFYFLPPPARQPL